MRKRRTIPYLREWELQGTTLTYGNYTAKFNKLAKFWIVADDADRLIATICQNNLNIMQRRSNLRFNSSSIRDLSGLTYMVETHKPK
jgi:hypothetical protein